VRTTSGFNKPIWVTEASYKTPATGQVMGDMYHVFWQELKNIPNVLGVTYFVASASDSAFANEVWVRNGASRGIAAAIAGLRA